MLSSMANKVDKDFVCENSFHESLSSVLVVAQCLTMLPVMGIKSTSAKGLKFEWRSYRTIYSLIAFGFAASYLILTIYAIFNASVTFNSFGLSKFIDSVCFMSESHVKLSISFNSSTIDFLHDNNVWSAQFYFVSTEMATTYAALGIC